MLRQSQSSSRVVVETQHRRSSSSDRHQRHPSQNQSPSQVERNTLPMVVHNQNVSSIRRKPSVEVKSLQKQVSYTFL